MRYEGKGNRRYGSFDSKKSPYRAEFSALDNKHFITDGKGFGFDKEKKEREPSNSSDRSSNVTGLCDIPGSGNSFDDSWFNDSSSLFDGDIGKLPDEPDFGFSSDEELNEEKSLEAKHKIDCIEKNSKVLILKTAPALNGWSSETEPCEKKETKRMKEGKKPVPYIHGCSSVMQINAKNSIMSFQAIEKMKTSYYRRASGATKRSRDAVVPTTIKRQRRTPCGPTLISDVDILSFASKIVGCPMCRCPSHLDS
mmetsp:Transcript_5472/g.8093  ORF Transcript_5472/g.8093 Transcript_5472/m.8093 type:complete len:253 (-) Transcript_5472:103-861(-)